jgi:hypothetical protein
MFNSPFVCARGGSKRAADVWVIRIEARDIRIHQRHERYPWDRNVTRQVLEQFFKLIFVSSDSIHDAVLCAERRGRTPARSIDAAIIENPAYGCDYWLANAIYRPRIHIVPAFPDD